MERACSRFSILRFDTGPKRSMGHFLGVEKRLFLIRGAEAAVTTGQPRRLNPVDPCPRGLPGVGSGRYYTRARAYTACAAASIIFGRFLSAAHAFLAIFGQVCFQGSPRARGCCIDGVCGVGAYPQLDLPRDTSRSRSAPEKSVQFGPDGAPFPSKTSITRGPPVVAVAVSVGPILPHR